jgi:hypothetical protein
LTVVPILGGRFVRLGYTWAYLGQLQEGSLLVGFDPKTGVVSGHWIDSWHMGVSAMVCSGKPAGEAITLRGSYGAPPGRHRGWRIDLTPGADSIRMAMLDVLPTELGGKEELAVEGTYSRAVLRAPRAPLLDEPPAARYSGHEVIVGTCHSPGAPGFPLTQPRSTHGDRNDAEG